MSTPAAYKEVLRRLDELRGDVIQLTKGEPMSDQAEELTAKIAGQEISLKSFQLNTLLTLVAVVLGCATAIGVWFHITEAKESRTEFVTALKEQTAAMRDQTQVARESNCLNRFEEKDRATRSEFCKSVTR